MTLYKDPEQNEIKYLLKHADLAGKRVLEIGCGEGRLTWQYANIPLSTIAIDLDHDALRVARADCPADLTDKVYFACIDSAQLPFAKEQFDIAILAWSLCCIEPASKLFALDEIRRVLVPDGMLIDMRAVLDAWQLDVVSTREVHRTGRVEDVASGLEHDEGANRAIAQAERNHWFQREAEEFFPLHYSWDTPSEMEEAVREDWQDFMLIDETSLQKTKSAWALSDADARVRLKIKMLIARWKVSKE